MVSKDMLVYSALCLFYKVRVVVLVVCDSMFYAACASLLVGEGSLHILRLGLLFALAAHCIRIAAVFWDRVERVLLVRRMRARMAANTYAAPYSGAVGGVGSE